MTANKRFKRQVRARARHTGESYSAALRHLRRDPQQEQTVHHDAPDQHRPGEATEAWTTFTVPEFEYAQQLPAGWQQRDPDLRNSPWETARFADPADLRRSLIVFRSPVGPGTDAGRVAEHAQHALANASFTDFSLREVTFAGHAGARLDCIRHDAGRIWAVRQFHAVSGAAAFCLAFGTCVPDQDEELSIAVADRFRLT